VIQHAILEAAGAAPGVVRPTSIDALKALAAADRMSPGEAAILAEGLTFQLNLQQALRIAAGDSFDPEMASAGLKTWLANHLGLKGFSALDSALARIQQAVEGVREGKLGPLSTDQSPSAV